MEKALTQFYASPEIYEKFPIGEAPTNRVFEFEFSRGRFVVKASTNHDDLDSEQDFTIQGRELALKEPGFDGPQMLYFGQINDDTLLARHRVPGVVLLEQMDPLSRRTDHLFKAWDLTLLLQKMNSSRTKSPTVFQRVESAIARLPVSEQTKGRLCHASEIVDNVFTGSEHVLYLDRHPEQTIVNGDVYGFIDVAYKGYAPIEFEAANLADYKFRIRPLDEFLEYAELSRKKFEPAAFTRDLAFAGAFMAKGREELRRFVIGEIDGAILSWMLYGKLMQRKEFSEISVNHKKVMDGLHYAREELTQLCSAR